MKIFFQIIFLIIGCLTAVTGNCGEIYRTHFEINVEDDMGKKTLSFPSNVISGAPLIFEIGNRSLSLVFSVEPPPSNMYLLTVSLSPKASSRNASSIPLLIQTFHAPLVGEKNGPLKFKMEQNGIKIYGAIALSLIR